MDQPYSPFATPPSPRFLAQNAYIWLVFRALYLDSEPPPAISPASRRGISSRRLFLRGTGDRFSTALKYATIHDRAVNP
jgi:hypothetical protein